MVEQESYEEDLRKKAIERGKYEGLDKNERLKNPGDLYYEKY